mmetsp:Transcript_10688/g.16371  ORF Transcript_10688/g.16371 Transcript_10688/m.16371 type:complete len:743 (-) Transcript_10688:2880-5108(-)
MSRWLKSVNTLLDSLDDTAGAASDVSGLPTSRGAIGQILSKRGLDYDSEDDEYEDDEEFYSEEGEDNAEEKEEEVVDFSDSSPTPNETSTTVESTLQQDPEYDSRISDSLELMPKQHSLPRKENTGAQAGEHQETSQEQKQTLALVNESSSSDDAVLVNKPSESESENSHEVQPSAKTQVQTEKPQETSIEGTSETKSSAPENSIQSPPSSSVSLLSSSEHSMLLQQLKKHKQDLKKATSETHQLRKHVMQLNQELETSEAEVKAQQEELERAAERMEKDRHRANEEREDLLDEQEEELETQKKQYEKELAELKDRYEDQLEELEERLSMVEEKRKIEGGDWTKELEDALQRERDALKKLNSVKDENSCLKSSLTKLDSQQSSLQTKLESAIQASQASIDRERQAEDKLDAALSIHSRQLSQRQAREAELERVVADMGAALARARQKEKGSKSTPIDTNQTSYKDKLDMTEDELETLRAQFMLEQERSDALRHELTEVSKERTVEALDAQANLRQHNREISDLKSTISRLEAAAHDRKSTPVMIASSDEEKSLYQQIEDSKKQIAALSEQLIENQNVAQNSKQEILTLKNRLRSANARATSAEDALNAATTKNAYEYQGDLAYSGATMKRRVKGGRTKNNVAVRSVRSALGLNPGRVSSDGMEQVAMTVDAIDSWLMDTGSFMKHEPLARLGLVLYLFILHLWSFCLVIFHTSSYEDVHGDFGSMSDPDGHGPQNSLLGPKP